MIIKQSVLQQFSGKSLKATVGIVNTFIDKPMTGGFIFIYLESLLLLLLASPWERG